MSKKVIERKPSDSWLIPLDILQEYIKRQFKKKKGKK